MNPLSGATRVHFIVGDPIAQVKSPAGVTQALQAHGRDAVCLPAHVAPRDLATWFDGITCARNVDGIIVTVPHKFAAYSLCASASPRAHFLGAVNTLKRRTDGLWHGDMFDGLGFVTALLRPQHVDPTQVLAQSDQPVPRHALLVGAGGAGSAIAQALVLAGVPHLAIHDDNPLRRDALITRLRALPTPTPANIVTGSADPTGADLVVNASPAGMQASDAIPIKLTALDPNCTVGCVVTAPAITPLIAAARARGCRTVTGSDMFACVRDLMVDFLIAPSVDAVEPSEMEAEDARPQR